MLLAQDNAHCPPKGISCNVSIRVTKDFVDETAYKCLCSSTNIEHEILFHSNARFLFQFHTPFYPSYQHHTHEYNLGFSLFSLATSVFLVGVDRLGSLAE